MDKTQKFYSENAWTFFENTLDSNMKSIYKNFEKNLKPKDKILDLGCGSGRDSIYFKNKGFKVVSIDYSKELCKIAKEKLNLDIVCMDMRDIHYSNEFNGIWACASLLHIEKKEILELLETCYNSLQDKGIMYLSFKQGQGEREIEKRFFNFYDEDTLIRLISCTKFKINKIWITEDVRKEHIDVKWLNAIIRKE